MNQPISKEIKERIISKIKNEGIPVSQLAEEYSINRKTIYGWLSRSANQTVSILETNKLKRENQQLLEVVGKLTFELEKTKKKLGVRVKRGSL